MRAAYNEHNFVYRVVYHWIMKTVYITFKITKSRDSYNI